jgi:hypothetical protein
MDVGDLAFIGGAVSPYHVVREGNSGCVPLGWNFTYVYGAVGSSGEINLRQILTDTALATAAGASWPLLNENKYLDGWLETLYTLCSNSPFVFNNSRNGIEDILGLASGIALGFFWGNVYDSEVYIENGVIEFAGVRVGPGKWWAIFYVVPSLFSALVLAILLRRTRHTLSSPWKTRPPQPRDERNRRSGLRGKLTILTSSIISPRRSFLAELPLLTPPSAPLKSAIILATARRRGGLEAEHSPSDHVTI